MKRMIITLILLTKTALPVLAAQTNTTGQWGVDAGAFINLSTALTSPSTLGKTIIVNKAMPINNKVVSGNRLVKVIQGGQINVAPGKTLSFTTASNFEAGDHTAFNGSSVVTGLKTARPEWWGAVAGLATAQNQYYLKALASLSNGGRLIFSGAGAYRFDLSGLSANYDNLLKLKSNQAIECRNGAYLLQTGAMSRYTFTGLFGPDITALPVKNLVFDSVDIRGIGSLMNAINLNVPQNSAPNSIEHVVIDKCNFENVASSVYITHRSDVGGLTRQVKDVKITNCTAKETWGSFITADGDGVLIQGNYAYGSSTPRNAYDAVSVHSGVDVRIIGNNWENFTAGQMLNIRNSPENKCGSRNIISKGNRYNNFKTAIQISTQPGESTYGVQNITIEGEIISTGSVAIHVDPARSVASTPFRNINIIGNTATDVVAGIYARGTGSVYLNTVKIQGNNIWLRPNTPEYGMYIGYLLFSTISNNSLYASDNSISYRSFIIEGPNVSCTVKDNIFYVGNKGNTTKPQTLL